MFGRLFRLIFFQLILCYHGLQRKVLRSVPKSNQIFILRNSDTKFNANNDDDTNFNEPGIIIDGTREAIVEVIEQSWLRVCQFMPPESLSLCENELREMMSLLVLASVRRSAITSNLDTRNSVQTMFQQADQNKDGKVSFLEWFEWLSSSDTYSSNQRIESHYSTDTANSVRIPKNQVITSDPMVDTLDRVLSHAVYTVKVASRIDRDPTFLCSAFVAGGVSSGGLDQEVCTAMLSRLSPTARELVTATLSLELGSMTPVIGTFDSPLMSELTNVSSTENSMSSFVRQISDIAQSTGISKPNRLLSSQRKSLDLYFMPQLKADTSQNDLDVSQNAIVDVSIEENDRLTSTTNSFAKTTSLLFRKRDTDNNDSDNYRSGAFIQTIDLASIPVLTAPSINDEVLKSNGPPVQADILLQDNSLQNREERNSIESSAYRQSTSYAYSAEESLSDEVFSEIAKKDSYRIALHTTSNSQSYNTRNSQNNDITSRDSRSDIKTILPRFDELSDSTPDKTEVEVYLRSPPNPITDFDTKNLNIIHSDSDSDSGANSDFTYTSKVVSANTVILHNQESDNNIESIDDDMKILSDSNALTQLITTESNEYKSAEELYKRASKTLLDIQRMRSSLTDFDDRNAGMLRQVILGRTGGRAEVLKLALSLRAARLQHAAALPNVVRQRIAVETLQVWAPLSFQVGLSAQVPELEVHSYVLLFPQSFNSFLGWFDCFRPLARKLLRKFRDSLQGKLQTDPVLPSFATKVIIYHIDFDCYKYS